MTDLNKKMGIKSGWRTIVLQSPEGLKQVLVFSKKRRLSGQFDFILYFTKRAAPLLKKFPVLIQHLDPKGSLWVSWPKSGQLNTDLNIKKIIKHAYDQGLVESKTISVDETWSAIKLTFPKKGKTYQNSYGKLKV